MNDVPREFRNALGCFATGVAVVTTAAAAGPIGLTVNSFASVSLNPPLILWSLDEASECKGAFLKATHFCINVLKDDAKELAQRLARKGDHAIDGDIAGHGAGGVPILIHALAHFECAVEARHAGGDHTIFVGRVLKHVHAEHGHPLVYYRGRYRSLAPTDAA